MTTIIHRIRLKPGVPPTRFEAWVRDSDYPSAPDLPSLEAFSVHRVSRSRGAAHEYFEIIQVTGLAAFQRDMCTPTFGRLVEAFEQMAEVVDELEGERLEPGFRRRPS